MDIPAKFVDLDPDLTCEQGRARIRLMLKMIEAKEGGPNAITRVCWAALGAEEKNREEARRWRALVWDHNYFPPIAREL